MINLTPAGERIAGRPGHEGGGWLGLVVAGLLAPQVLPAAVPLAYRPAPPDNPLKGFVPYLRATTNFPHSLEWDYTRLSEVMTGPTNFHWEPFEQKLAAAASRGHQFIARFYLEWPGRATGVPAYLLEAGLTLHRWTNTNTQPLPPALDHTPDYEDPRLRAALTNFIHALGQRYDGDPRLGFMGLGLLGTWGEWHNYPNQKWFASKAVQREVLGVILLLVERRRRLGRVRTDGASRPGQCRRLPRRLSLRTLPDLVLRL